MYPRPSRKTKKWRKWGKSNEKRNIEKKIYNVLDDIKGNKESSCKYYTFDWKRGTYSCKLLQKSQFSRLVWVSHPTRGKSAASVKHCFAKQAWDSFNLKCIGLPPTWAHFVNVLLKHNWLKIDWYTYSEVDSKEIQRVTPCQRSLQVLLTNIKLHTL